MDMPFFDTSDAEFYELFPKNGDVKHDKHGEWCYYCGVWYVVQPLSEEGVWAYVNGEWTFGVWVYQAGWTFEPRHTDQVYEPVDYEDRDLD